MVGYMIPCTWIFQSMENTVALTWRCSGLRTSTQNFTSFGIGKWTSAIQVTFITCWRNSRHLPRSSHEKGYGSEMVDSMFQQFMVHGRIFVKWSEFIQSLEQRVQLTFGMVSNPATLMLLKTPKAKLEGLS